MLHSSGLSRNFLEIFFIRLESSADGEFCLRKLTITSSDRHSTRKHTNKQKSINIVYFGPRWLSDKFGALRPEGRTSESHSSHNIRTLGKASPSLTVACSASAY